MMQPRTIATVPPHQAGRPVRPAVAFAERDRELVMLLALGYTDASAARRLGISQRSVTNIVRSLMDRLCVNNRFQLGLALGRLGLAPSAPGATVG